MPKSRFKITKTVREYKIFRNTRLSLKLGEGAILECFPIKNTPQKNIHGGKTVVEVRNLSGSANGFTPIHDINFKLQNGQIYGILGDGESGGSTLLAMLAGALLPAEGEVRLGGFDTARDAMQARRQVGYLPRAHKPAGDLTPTEYLLLTAEMKGMDYNRSVRRVAELLDWAALDTKRSVLIGKLSETDRRLLGIAQALLGNPQFLLFDEVTAALPLKEAQSTRKWIEELRGEKTVFWYSQSASELRAVCDRILVIKSGSLVEIATPDALLSTTADWQNTPAPQTPQTAPKKTSRWEILTRGSKDFEVIDTNESEDAR